MAENLYLSPYIRQACDEFSYVTTELDRIIRKQTNSNEASDLFAPECMNADCCFHWIKERAQHLEQQLND